MLLNRLEGRLPWKVVLPAKMMMLSTEQRSIMMPSTEQGSVTNTTPALVTQSQNFDFLMVIGGYIGSFLQLQPSNRTSVALQDLQFTSRHCRSLAFVNQFHPAKVRDMVRAAGLDAEEALVEKHFLVLLFVTTVLCHTQPPARSSDPAMNILPSVCCHSVCPQNFSLLHSQEGVFVVALSCAWIIQDNLLTSGSASKPHCKSHEHTFHRKGQDLHVLGEHFSTSGSNQ